MEVSGCQVEMGVQRRMLTSTTGSSQLASKKRMFSWPPRKRKSACTSLSNRLHAPPVSNRMEKLLQAGSAAQRALHPLKVKSVSFLDVLMGCEVRVPLALQICEGRGMSVLCVDVPCAVVLVDPVAVESVVAEPVAEPVAVEPVVAEPVVEPVVVESVVAEPVVESVAEPVVVESVVAEPVAESVPRVLSVPCVVWVELPELVSVPLPEGRPVG